MSHHTRRWLGRFGFIALSSSVFTVEFLRGLNLITVRLNFVVIVLVVVILQAFISNLMFTGFISLSGLLFIRQLVPKPPMTSVESAKPVTAIVPVYEDAEVLETSVTSLLQSSYPVRVFIVCEPDDEQSLNQARFLADASTAVTYLINTQYPGSKAGAINYAIEQTDTKYIGVFDADECVDSNFLRRAVAQLQNVHEVDVVQGRTIPRPDGFLESLAYYESVLLSYTGRRLLYAVTGFRIAASRAVVFRRSAIEDIGGYDQSMLTEDYYFAYQCYTNGLTVHESLRYPSTIEAAHTIDDWWGQRKRWIRGYVQVFHRLLTDAIPPQSHRDLLGLAICGSTLIGGVLLISLLSKFFVLFLIGAGVLTLLPLGAVVTLAVTIRYLDYRNGPLDRIGLSWLFAPILFPLYGLVATKAVVEYIAQGRGEWYSVTKHA